MKQSYDNPEARDAAIGVLESLQNIVGGHFPWCDDYLQPVKVLCTCGMDLMRQAKGKLNNERFEEYSLWADALGMD